ncbi:S8 family peptidase [Paractinoplanes globisporus]|uniref:S8 family serine peptidase n=1 Tax=Paractinoplanes globisporus TaxID=113565 RepID=A0ABW6WSZ3_9ACTN|nr:S8 family peptidase [Actinoplanes globisporus]
MRTHTGRLASRLALLTAAATSTLCGIAGTAMAHQPVARTGVILDAGSADAIANSYIVVLRPGESGVGLLQRYGGQLVDTYTSVHGFHATMTAQQAAHLAADSSVKYVEQDATVAAADDPAPWGLDRIDQRALPLSKSYTAPSAAGVTAYVIDSGIRITHREFGGRATSGWDFVDNDANADDCKGHGTHVAGTIGGATYGVVRGIKLVSVRVLDCKGSGAYSDIIAGIDWVTAHAAKPAVANMSLGGTVSKALDDAVERSIAKGITYAVAAGNDHRDACKQSPAHAPDAITVGATDQNDARATFSNFGSCVDIFAPGVRIQSAASDSNTGSKLMSGTSMASPHVAGAAALVLAAHPSWTPAQVRDDLVGHADADLIRGPGKNSPNKLLFTGYLSRS